MTDIDKKLKEILNKLLLTPFNRIDMEQVIEEIKDAILTTNLMYEVERKK